LAEAPLEHSYSACRPLQEKFETNECEDKKPDINQVGFWNFIGGGNRKYATSQPDQERIKRAPYAIDKPVRVRIPQHAVAHIQVGDGVS
jgi:hypothetical protein